MGYNQIPQYNNSNCNISKNKTSKKSVSNLVKIVGGITLTVVAILPLSGCDEVYRIPSRGGYGRRQPTIIITPRGHIHHPGCGHQRRPDYRRGGRRHDNRPFQNRPYGNRGNHSGRRRHR